jgi:hypothetical protein
MQPDEMNAVRQLAETFLDFPLWGVPVKTVLDLFLSLLITLGIGYRGCKYTYAAACWLRRKKPAKVVVHDSDDDPVAEELGCGCGCDDGYACRCASCPEGGQCFRCIAAGNLMGSSDAFIECMAALNCIEPAYDKVNKTLHCLSMTVGFSEGMSSLVRVGEQPVKTWEVCSVAFGGKNILPMLSDKEQKLIRDYAEQLRLEVIQRDADRENRAIAFDMRQARMKEQNERHLRVLQRQMSKFKGDGNKVKDDEPPVAGLMYDEPEDCESTHAPLLPHQRTGVPATVKQSVPVSRSKLPPVINPRSGSK